MKGEFTQPVQVRSKEVSVRLGSYPGDGEGYQPIEALGTEVRLGGYRQFPIQNVFGTLGVLSPESCPHVVRSAPRMP